MNELLSLLNYNSKTGKFTWAGKSKFSNVKIGSEAGYVERNGYVRISFRGRRYGAHQLVWMLVYGTWPKFLDHINGVRSDNRISNLRESSHRLNQLNRKEHRQGKFPGVRFMPSRNKWIARMSINGKDTCVGYCNTEIEAQQAYLKKLKELFPQSFKEYSHQIRSRQKKLSPR